MTHKNRFAGLTLIELLAVLIILVAIAGTLVPLIPDVTRQSHGATGADSIKEITKSILLYQQTQGGFPDGYDSLIDGGAPIVTGGMARTVALDLSSDANKDVIIDALESAGITETFEHDLTASNQTFGGVTTNGALIISGGSASGHVAALTETGETDLGLPASKLTQSSSNIVRYLAFGVGEKTTAIGKTMLSAPVMYSPDVDPIEKYVRYAVIYAVKESGHLELASVSGLHHMNSGMVMFAGLEHHLEEYYEAIN